MSILMLSGLAEPVAAAAATAPPAAAAVSAAAHVPAAAPQAPKSLSPAMAKALAVPSGTEQECPVPASPFQEQCQVLINHAGHTAGTVSPAGVTGTPAGGFSPANLRAAYGLSGTSVTAGMTVAIVEAYNDPHLAADVAAYRQYYKLPALTCASGAGCLRVYNQYGSTSSLPSATNTGWEDESALDAEMVSAICPSCSIDVFEANSPTLADLGAAENSAARVAKVISNSWNGTADSDFPGVTAFDSMYFDHPGVAITFASGDFGYGAGYPASSQLVTSVGGTYLSPDRAGGYTARVWSGSGAGCSAGEPQPAWEEDASGSIASQWCANRNENDVSAVANGPSGISLYSTSGDCNQNGHWCDAYGTSVSAPVIAALYALAGQPAAGTYPVSYLYQSTNRADLKHVTAGSDGACSQAYLCNAADSLPDGYNGPAGLGTPVSLSAFASNASGNVVSAVNPGTYDLQAGRTYHLPAIEAHDSAAGQTLAYSATGLPSGLSLNSGNGAISGTVASPSQALVHLTVTDGTSAKSTVTFRIVVLKSMITAYHPGNGQIRLDLGGMCMNDAGNSGANGTKVRVWKCGGAASEVWQYLPSGEPGAPGTVRIHGKCLNVEYKSTRNGASLNLYQCDGNANQAWQITGVAGELYNPVSGKCVNDPGGSTRNGTQLNIWSCNWTTRQAWTLPASPITSEVRLTGKCVNDAGNSSGNGTHIISWKCDGYPQQRFTIGLDGTLRIHGKCVNVVGQGTRDGAAVDLYTCASQFPAEQWALTANGTIENPHSGKCLAIPGDQTGNGVRLRLEECYGLPGEVWAVS